MVVFVGMLLGIVLPDPFWEFGGGFAGIYIDLVPVGLLQEFGVCEADLLGAGVADEAVRWC